MHGCARQHTEYERPNFFIKLRLSITAINVKTRNWEHEQETLRRMVSCHWLPAASVRSSPAFSHRTKLGWIVGLNKSVVGVREGRGRDDLTDEIAKKEREGGRPPTQNNVPQRQRHSGAVGRPSTRKVSSETIIIMCFLPRKFFPLALCCSLDRLARGDFLLPRMELNEPPCLFAIPSRGCVSAIFTLLLSLYTVVGQFWEHFACVSTGVCLTFLRIF